MKDSLLMSFPEALLEALAIHEALRKLGFSSGQIFMHRNPPPRHDIVVVLRHQGKQLAVTAGILTDADWGEKWTKLIGLFNDHKITDSEFGDWYEKSWAGRHPVELVTVMELKGISPPLRRN